MSNYPILAKNNSRLTAAGCFFGVWGVGCGVWGVGFGRELSRTGVGCGVWGVGCGVWGEQRCL
ncbi:MAG: hypothetical protein O9336_17815, partial [Microcystis sp. LE19-98.1E]|nr:hypothetical protein [Microcystis sp. LE19-98.1E]